MIQMSAHTLEPCIPLPVERIGDLQGAPPHREEKSGEERRSGGRQ